MPRSMSDRTGGRPVGVCTRMFPGWRSACIRLSTNSIFRYTSSPLEEEEEEEAVVNAVEVEVCR